MPSFSTGRYPNLGPQLLAKYGVILVDRAGWEIAERIREGEQIRIVDSRIENLGVGAVGEDCADRGNDPAAPSRSPVQFNLPG